jgi:hypothetical protein
MRPIAEKRREADAENSAVKPTGSRQNDEKKVDALKTLKRNASQPNHLSTIRRQPSFLPSAKPTGHGTNILVSHLLQTLRHKRGTTAAAAIADDGLLHIGNLFLDLELDHATAEMDGILCVFLVPIALSRTSMRNASPRCDSAAASAGAI